MTTLFERCTGSFPGLGTRAASYAGAMLVCVLLGAGCQTPQWDKVRRDQAEGFLAETARITEEAVAERSPLDLDDCIAIALENSLAVRTAHIQTRIAALDRRTAFANFLPALDLNLNYTSMDRQPESRILGGMSTPVQDRAILEGAVQMQLPLFAPATWYLYSLRQRGEEIATLAEDYVRQQTALEVTASYYQCLMLKEREGALASQAAAAERLAQQTSDYLAEGLVTPAQAEQTALLHALRLNELDSLKRGQQSAAAGLLSAMGLSPLAGLALAPSQPLEAPGEPIEELVLRALLEHPGLQIADRQMVMEEDKVRLAITQFLPQLVGFANRTSTSNSFIKYPDFTVTGISGILSLFQGFANVNAYKAARASQEEAFLRREELCFTVMTGVIRAHLQVQDAAAARTLAGQALKAAETRLAEAEAQWEEGMLNTAERLNAAAERDRAQCDVLLAQFQEQVALATLRHVMGSAYLGAAEPGELTNAL